jgi:hypothetical protein
MAAVATPSSRSSFDSFASSNPARRQYHRLKKNAEPKANVWVDMSSDLPKPLERRFVDVKKRLVTPDKYDAVQASWDRLLVALKEKAEEIEEAGPSVRSSPRR